MSRSPEDEDHIISPASLARRPADPQWRVAVARKIAPLGYRELGDLGETQVSVVSCLTCGVLNVTFRQLYDRHEWARRCMRAGGSQRDGCHGSTTRLYDLDDTHRAAFKLGGWPAVLDMVRARFGGE